MNRYAQGYLSGMTYLRDNLILAHLASKHAANEDTGKESVGGILVLNRLLKTASKKSKSEQALTKLSDLLTQHR
jgi:hypothetical protein